ncbi:sigma-70 family RNA polymerase sigma factor [Rhabdothermincola salaria]|uniref:sigma-70 family RNA polymerase sigma factor n=1 Tax=Rhabdothermincola salaria TaxID=2903142 RepID=UPI001E2A74C7|nr:sigma-70 family RNA polymerase sigma factor [Rhabdothermincola salaria]
MEFEWFFTTYYGRVVRVLSAAWGDEEAAADAAQEAFARAFARWRRVQGMARPDGWVYVTAANLMKRQEPKHPGPEAGWDLRAPDAAEPVATRLALRDAVALLPARQRQVVVLRYLGQLSTAEVAQALGCAEGTVKSTLHSALKALRVELEDDDEGR